MRAAPLAAVWLSSDRRSRAPSQYHRAERRLAQPRDQNAATTWAGLAAEHRAAASRALLQKHHHRDRMEGTVARLRDSLRDDLQIRMLCEPRSYRFAERRALGRARSGEYFHAGVAGDWQEDAEC